MAEALAVVVSGAGVASFALQLVDCAIKLRRLWADIKDAPEDVVNLIDEIQTLSRVLEAINATHTPEIGNAMFDQCYVFCEQGVRNLESVARDLEKLVRQKTPVGVLRVVLKKDVIAKHRSQLERAKTSLLLAQQTYQTSLHAQQLQKVEAILATQGQLLLQPVQLLCRPHTPARNQVGGVEDVPDPTKAERNKYPSDRTLSVRRTPPKYHKREKDRLSFRTPTWLTNRVWDIRLAARLEYLEICRFLLEQGVDSKTEGFHGFTPLRQLLCYGTNTGYPLVDIHRLLLTEADTEELIDSESVVRLFSATFWMVLPLGAMKLLQQTICFPWSSIDLEERIRLAICSEYEAELFKLILGPGSLSKEAFEARPTLPLLTLHETLFSTIARGVGCCCGQKSDEASWQAVLREAVSVDGHLCSSEWDRSPLVEFLDGLMWHNARAGFPEQAHRHWLQSLQHAGADLAEYGQLESRNLKSSKSWHNIYLRCWSGRHMLAHFPSDGVRIVGLAYGPEPDDWHIWFSWSLDEWAGDFWYMVENPELFETPEQFAIPGAWLSEEPEQCDPELEEE